ncbi:unnamed protein product [marine sediment metagenome]|uniref:Uncharacterized protein n=1 Tax=marine sediment metagenome TaxID=412755 RepID=X1RRS6_9ZZZZ
MAGYKIFHCKECSQEIHVHNKERLLVVKNGCDHIPEYLSKSKIKKLMYVRKYPIELRSVPNYL